MFLTIQIEKEEKRGESSSSSVSSSSESSFDSSHFPTKLFFNCILSLPLLDLFQPFIFPWMKKEVLIKTASVEAMRVRYVLFMTGPSTTMDLGLFREDDG